MRDRQASRRRTRRGWLTHVLVALLLAAPAWGESCSTASDMDAGTRQALEQAARRYFADLQRGDSAALRQEAIASVAANFSGIEQAVKEHVGVFQDALPALRDSFLLGAQGQATLERAEFLCGIFGAEGLTPYSVVFVLNNLPPGRYAVVILDTKVKGGADAVSFVLQQEPAMTGAWKLAGMYVNPTHIGEHDGHWFWEQARGYKAKGQLYNAWFYYGQARQLLAPVSFMTTADLEKAYDEQQKLAPPDLPLKAPVELMAEGGRSFKITQMFPVPDQSDAAGGLDLVADYQAASVADTQQAYLDNLAVIHALAAKYPELREAFVGIGARAVDPAGKSYGTLLAVTELK